MRSVNKVILIGHLTRDPELRQTSGGQSVATFSIATNRVWNTSGGDRQESTEFHDLVAWGKLAEICDQYLSKGIAVYVEGRLNTRNWEAQDGSKRYKTEVVVNDLNILTKKGDAPAKMPSSTASTASTPESTPEAMTDSVDIDSSFETAETTDSERINVEDIPF